MRLIQFLFFLAPVTLLAQRTVTNLQAGWKFTKDSTERAYMIDFDDRDWKDVNVPHDWGVDGGFILDGDGATGKLPWRGEGWYRLKFNIPEDYEGKRLYLVFDGVMAFPKVYFNGKFAGGWDYGYNSFYVEITDLVRAGGENVLAVHADTRSHDSRWYPGAGIYRKVQLLVVNPIHIDIWGTYITTPIIKPHYADVRVSVAVNNIPFTDSEITVRNTIYTQDNRKVVEQQEIVRLNRQQQFVEMTLTIPNPRRWDIESPHLYTLATEIYQANEQIDSQSTTFGIRTIRFTPDDGFYLNDRRVQFKGVNLHHDLGPLGAAFNKRAMQRQLEIMKAMGCNAIRTSHNTPAPELLDLCDEMGLLVIDEIFDKYDGKADITDTTDFDAFAHRNIRNFVMRDRNHPSIFLWSVGNEIGDVQWNRNNGFWKLKTMLNYVEKYDDSRPVTLVCDNQQSAELRHFDFYDVHAWNYGRRYALARKLEPNKAVIISESASTVSTRGFYEFPLPEEKTAFTNSMHVSSYDLNAPDWAEIADDDFMWQQDEPYIAGEFVWTGFDYLGEPTPYDPWSMRRRGMDPSNASRSSYFGIVDLCGIPKDRYYLYKSYWMPEDTTIHILPHWNWPERGGKNVPVFVYTNGDCAELFVNGRSQGMQCKKPRSDNSVERFRLMWKDVLYEPGEVRAVVYREGEKLGESIVRTAGEPAQLRLTPDRSVLSPDGEDLSFILVEALDEQGDLCPLAMNEIHVALRMPEELTIPDADHGSTILDADRELSILNPSIAAVDNGNPRSFNPFKSSSVALFYGKAMIIIRAGVSRGQVEVNVKSKGLKEATATLHMR